MLNYYKYLPVSNEDKKWGLHVLNAGCSRSQKSELYPSLDHPSHHYFNWESGRILQEYQVLYISQGEGVFESQHCPNTKITEGTVFFLFPGEWHRYRPNPEKGWNEYWIGFNGEIAKKLEKNGFISRTTPVVHIGLQQSIIDLFTLIIDKTRTEKSGYQPLVSGAVMHLLGQTHSLAKQEVAKQEDISEAIVNKAIALLRCGYQMNISIEQIAEELQVSYSWFRKAFKVYTGMAPGQYLLQLRVDKAKMLLSDHHKTIKEIAYDLGFESAFYFSKIFKQKTGVSPEMYRKNLETQLIGADLK
jgi:AraC-like DNA-binding protein